MNYGGSTKMLPSLLGYYELTDAGKKYAIYVDTGKRHKIDGSPFRQIKWYSLVVEVLKAYLDGTIKR